MVKMSGASHHNKANSNWERETQNRGKLQRVRNKQNAPLEDNEGIKKQALLKEIGSHMKDIFRMLTKWQLKKPSSTWRESEEFTGCNCASWMFAEQSLGMHFLISSYLLWPPSSKACSVSFSHLGWWDPNCTLWATSPNYQQAKHLHANRKATPSTAAAEKQLINAHPELPSGKLPRHHPECKQQDCPGREKGSQPLPKLCFWLADYLMVPSAGVMIVTSPMCQL